MWRTLFLALVLSFWALCPIFSQDSLSQKLQTAKELIAELSTMNEKLENRLLELTSQLDEKDRQLTKLSESMTKLSELLAIIKQENENQNLEMKIQADLLQNRRSLEQEQSAYLTVFEILAGVLGAGWTIDRVFFR